eukprot:5903062-Amphidinium_carterae.1
MEASTSEDVPGCLQRLQNSRDDLGLWADCASKALRGLLVNAGAFAVTRSTSDLQPLKQSIGENMALWTCGVQRQRERKII